MGECPFCILSDNGNRLKFSREIGFSCFGFEKRSKNTPALTGPVKNKLVPLKQAPERPPPTSRKPTLSPDDKPLPTNPQKGTCRAIVREFPLPSNDQEFARPSIPSIEEEENM